MESSTSSKHKAVWDWLQTCTEIADLFFNFSGEMQGSTLFAPITVYKDTANIEFADGSSERFYDYALAQIRPIDTTPNETGNIDQLEEFEALAEWISEQNDDKNFPEFPTGNTITEVSVLESNAGYVAAQDQYNAKYMLQFRIVYNHEKGA